MQDRIAVVQARLYKQYNALDTNLTSLNSLSSLVTQQITTWNKSGLSGPPIQQAQPTLAGWAFSCVAHSSALDNSTASWPRQTRTERPEARLSGFDFRPDRIIFPTLGWDRSLYFVQTSHRVDRSSCIH
jgi:hypothetical protein